MPEFSRLLPRVYRTAGNNINTIRRDYDQPYEPSRIVVVLRDKGTFSCKSRKNLLRQAGPSTQQTTRPAAACPAHEVPAKTASLPVRWRDVLIRL